MQSCHCKEARPETSENNFLEEEKPKSSKKASSQRSKSNKKDKRELEEEKDNEIDKLEALLGNVTVSIKSSSFYDKIVEDYTNITHIEEYIASTKMLEKLKANEGLRETRDKAEALLLKEKAAERERKRETGKEMHQFERESEGIQGNSRMSSLTKRKSRYGLGDSKVPGDSVSSVFETYDKDDDGDER